MAVMKKEVEIKEDDFVFMARVKLGDQVQILVNGKEVSGGLATRDQIIGKLTADCDFLKKLMEVNGYTIL
jgi:hypothetical protein